MSRFLFVVPPLVGHVNPTVSVARALEGRGHEVAWVGHPGRVRPLLRPDARLFALSEDVSPELVDQVRAKAATLRGPAALKFLWEDFLVPLARGMRPGVEAAVTDFAPHVIRADQQTVAGGIVARRRGLPWATIATTSAGVTDPLGTLPEVKRWVRDRLAELEREAELPLAESGELSPHAVIAFTTRALVPGEFPAHYHFVGPSISDRAEVAEFPMDRLRRPCVLVSMGTVNADASARFYATTIAALRDQAFQVILVAPAELDAPANFLIRSYVPQLALLPHVDAVVCHGGHNTTCEALANGLPLVIAPIKDDQPIVADQVVAAGAGLRVKFGRIQPPELLAAVTRVMTGVFSGSPPSACAIRSRRPAGPRLLLHISRRSHDVRDDPARGRAGRGCDPHAPPDRCVARASSAAGGDVARILTAPGVTVADETARAATAYAREQRIDVLDLVPRDLPAIRAMSLAQVVDPAAYRGDRLGPGRTAGHAVVISAEVAQRAQLEHAGALVDFVRLANRLKHYGTGDVAIAPAEHARPHELAVRLEMLHATLGPTAPLALAVLPILWALIGLGSGCARCTASRRWIAWQLQPLIALAFPRRCGCAISSPSRCSACRSSSTCSCARSSGAASPSTSSAPPTAKLLAGDPAGAPVRATSRDLPDLRARAIWSAVARRHGDLLQHKPGTFTLEAAAAAIMRVPESAAVDRGTRFLLQGLLRRARRVGDGVHFQLRRRAVSPSRADGARQRRRRRSAGSTSAPATATSASPRAASSRTRPSTAWISPNRSKKRSGAAGSRPRIEACSLELAPTIAARYDAISMKSGHLEHTLDPRAESSPPRTSRSRMAGHLMTSEGSRIPSSCSGACSVATRLPWVPAAAHSSAVGREPREGCCANAASRRWNGTAAAGPPARRLVLRVVAVPRSTRPVAAAAVALARPDRRRPALDRVDHRYTAGSSARSWSTT